MARLQLTADDIAYDPSAHRSTAPDGRAVPHVTAVLKAAGLGTDFEELKSMGARREADIELARQRGSAVHADCHALDDNDLLWDTVDPRVKPYVEAWATCREQMGLMPEDRERRLFHPTYWYTGIMDGVFLRKSGRRMLRILGDIKNGDPSSAAAQYQTAAYAKAYEHAHTGRRIDERWAIWLVPGRQVPYRIFNYSDPAEYPDTALHFPVFAAALTVYDAQVRQGKVRGDREINRLMEEAS